MLNRIQNNLLSGSAEPLNLVERVLRAINRSHYTSVNCSNCGNKVKKTLSSRTHVCSCGYVADRDPNAAINILQLGLTLGEICPPQLVKTCWVTTSRRTKNPRP